MQILKWLRLYVTYWYCRLKYPILYNIHSWQCLLNEWLPRHLPVLITNFFFLCSRQIRLKYIISCLLWQDRQFTWWWWWWWWWWWYRCYFNMWCGSYTWCSCWNMQKTSHMTMPSCLIYFLKSHCIYVYFLMLQCEIFQQLSLYAHAQQTYFICR